MGNERVRVRDCAKVDDIILKPNEHFLEQQVINDKGQVYGNRPMKIGILNPYVLMGVVSQKKNFFNQPLVKNDMIDAINQYTSAVKIEPVTEKNLFAPDSVLFQPLVSTQIVRRCSDTVMMSHVAMASFAFKQNMATPITSTGVSTGASDPSNPKNSEYGTPATMGTATTPAGLPSPARVKTSNDRKEFIGDVIQGACLDCWFMAALYSWAWWKKVPPLLTAINGVYTISFNSYDYNTTIWKTTGINVKPALPLNTRSQLVFAQQTPENEIWPALYEKAYAEYKNLNSFTIPGATQGTSPGPYDPDTGLFQKGDPLIALINISGYLPTEGANNSANRPTVYKTKNLVNNPYQGTTAFDVLKLCNNSTYYTMWPTVAWTYAPGSDAFPQTGWPVNSVLAPSHSYSVLGRYEDIASTDPKKKYYIVLRNPWGLPISKDTAPVAFKDSLASKIWNPDQVLASLNMNLGNNSYGIFGLENSAFEKYFEGFGWSQFRSVTAG